MVGAGRAASQVEALQEQVEQLQAQAQVAGAGQAAALQEQVDRLQGRLQTQEALFAEANTAKTSAEV